MVGMQKINQPRYTACAVTLNGVAFSRVLRRQGGGMSALRLRMLQLEQSTRDAEDRERER